MQQDDMYDRFNVGTDHMTNTMVANETGKFKFEAPAIGNKPVEIDFCPNRCPGLFVFGNHCQESCKPVRYGPLNAVDDNRRSFSFL